MITGKFALVGFGTALEDKIPEAHASLVNFFHGNSKVRGCELSTLQVSTKKKNVFLNYEIWESEKIWKAHFNSDHVQEFYRVTPKCFADFHVNKYTQFRGSHGIYHYGSQASLEKQVSVLGSLTAQEGKVMELKKLMQDFFAKNKDVPGCLFNSVHVNKKNPNTIMAFEVWKDNAAWLQHLQQARAIEFSEQSQSLITGLEFDTFKCLSIEM